MNPVTRRLGFVLPIVLIAGFITVAGQRIGSVPVPDNGDESMILQVPYEILYRNKFGWPMYRYLGGNIENNWHSFRPVYYLMLTGFFKIFGWGLTQGRVFNLITAALTLLMVHLIGSRLLDWRTGLTGVVMLVSDPTFFERSRMIRNECPAAMFALLAFYLYEMAEDRKQGSLYIASGVAAGAGVMVHTNLLYLLAAIFLLMLLRRGRAIFSGSQLYQFGGAAIAVMAYEIISDVLDYKNVQLQYRGDKAHFSVHTPVDLWNNLLLEPGRYESWYAGGELISGTSPVLLHSFQVLLLVAAIYLAYLCAKKIRHGNVMADPRMRILLVTAVAVLFLALLTGHKRKYTVYMANLLPWFALCVGILARDFLEFISALRLRPWPAARGLRNAAPALTATMVLAYGLLFVRQNYRYYRELRRPGHASFAEFATALREIIPGGVCPVSRGWPVIWLVFPESDRCYATLEGRMDDALDIIGNDFALIIAPGREADWPKAFSDSFHFLGEMDGTPYGDFRIYYTGTNPNYDNVTPKRFQFLGNRPGHVESHVESPFEGHQENRVDNQVETSRPRLSPEAKLTSALGTLYRIKVMPD